MENLTCSTMPELRGMGQGNSSLSEWLVKALQSLPKIQVIFDFNSTDSDTVCIFLSELALYIPQTHSETDWYSNYSDWLVFWILLALIGEAGRYF